MIQNIVFDLGNVLLSFKPMIFLQKMYDTEKAENLYKCIFLSKEWLDLDRGIIESDEAIDIISKRCPEYYDNIKDVINYWTQILTPIQGSIDILESLKEKGYKTYLLTNFHKKAFEEVSRKHDFLKNFDGRVVSSDVLLLKPEKEIFTNLCKKYGIKPEESVFIDDTAENVVAAKEIGFKTAYFESPEQLRNELISLGV